MSYIYDKISKNVLVIIPLFIALCSFGANIFMRVTVEPKEYGEYSIYFFTVTTLVGIGIAGFDQVLIRFSKINNGILSLDLNVIIFGVFSFLISPVLLFYFLYYFGVVTELNIYFVLISVFACLASVLSIAYNISGHLLAHYVFNSGWKVLLFLFVVFSCFLNQRLLDFDFVFVVSLFVPLFFFFVFRIKIVVSKLSVFGMRDISLLYVSSLMSVGSYMVFDGLDRFLLISNFNPVIFGDYFFAFNFLLAPVAIMTSYFSAKRLSIYKSSPSFLSIAKDFKFISVVSFVCTIFLSVLLIFLVDFKLFNLGNVKLDTLIIIVFICALRNGYTLLSTAYKVIASSRTLIIIAFFFGVLSLVVYSAFGAFKIQASINHILFLVVLFWILRSAVYLLFIHKDLNCNFK